MKILIVAATEAEISPLRKLNSPFHHLSFVTTGAGIPSTVYSLACHLRDHKYDLAINCGIAGSFDRSLSLGEVVQVSEDTFADMGAEDDDQFLSMEELGLEGKINFQNSLKLSSSHLKPVKGITVNTVHGQADSINKVKERLFPQVETMEGAAFYFVCEKENIPAIQVRAISNYVEKRNKAAWNIPLALENLQTAVKHLISNLS